MLSAKIAERESKQGDLFRVMLRDVVDPKPPLVIFANSINWEVIEKNISPLFCSNNGRPALAVRMVTGLLYLKNAYNLGDKALLETWLENPYWQYFTGGIFFEHKLPFETANAIKQSFSKADSFFLWFIAILVRPDCIQENTEEEKTL